MISRSLLTPGAQSLLCLSALRVRANADKERQEVIDRDTEIVSSIRSALKTRLGADRFDLWLGSATRIAAQSGGVRITADTRFRIDHMRKTLLTEIQAVTRELIGPTASVDFDVDPSLGETSASVAVSRDERKSGTIPGQVESQPRPEAQPCLRTCESRGTHPPQNGRRFATLPQYVVGPCNQLAFHSAQMVVQQLGQITPFFVHGPTGVGKTHLLEGIWSEIRRRGGRRVIYLSAEQFTTYFLQALRGSGLPSFRQKYRGVDLLILDDVQFFAGKQATIIELLHTMDALLRDSRQLVLAADRPPAKLGELGAEFNARIAGGLVCALQPLDTETRGRVLKGLAERRGLALDEEVLEYIARRAPGDGRQLSGAMNRLWACSISQQEIAGLRLAEATVEELFPQSCRVVRLDDIQRAVCDEFDIEPETLRSDRRARSVSQPRMLAMWLARKHTRAALTEISEFFGRRSHSTVVSAQNKVERWVLDGRRVQCSHRACDVRDVVKRLERSLRA